MRPFIRLRKSAEQRAGDAREKASGQAFHVLQHETFVGRVSKKFFHGPDIYQRFNQSAIAAGASFLAWRLLQRKAHLKPAQNGKDDRAEQA